MLMLKKRKMEIMKIDRNKKNSKKIQKNINKKIDIYIS